MPANTVLNSGKSRLIETPVREISVPVGTVSVTDTDDNVYTIKTGESQVFDPPKAGLTVFAIGQGGARLSVFYGDEEGAPSPEPPAAPVKRVRRSRPKPAAKRAKPESKKSSAKKASRKR
jgi:hypothetical protein